MLPTPMQTTGSGKEFKTIIAGSTASILMHIKQIGTFWR